MCYRRFAAMQSTTELRGERGCTDMANNMLTHYAGDHFEHVINACTSLHIFETDRNFECRIWFWKHQSNMVLRLYMCKKTLWASVFLLYVLKESSQHLYCAYVVSYVIRVCLFSTPLWKIWIGIRLCSAEQHDKELRSAIVLSCISSTWEFRRYP